MSLYTALARPALFRLSADQAHDWTVRAAAGLGAVPGALAPLRWWLRYADPILQRDYLGLSFQNPLGIAAGFDKNAQAVPFLQALGLGFVEIGSITAQPGAGNPKPRSFRLPADASLINRMGLNNQGADVVTQRLAALRHRGRVKVPVGINIAKTHDPAICGTAAHADYAYSLQRAKTVADYITLNISCPNTAEGKTFEEPEGLAELLQALDWRDDAQMPPVLVKLSVDLPSTQLAELLAVCEGFAVAGYVAVNTSTRREGLQTDSATLDKIGAGGLSGAAIADRSTAVIAAIAAQTGGQKLIMGVGGIASAHDAIAKLQAGAHLLQVYTGLVYQGPGLIRQINRGVAEFLRTGTVPGQT